MRKILLTGATGVIGRRVLPELVRAGHHVRAVARTAEKAATITAAGAEPITLDLFDAGAVAAAVDGRDTVIHLATNIPPIADAAEPAAWAINDRLRSEASNHLASAAIASGVDTYIGESMTFPYVDGGSDWIDESQPCTYHAGSRTAAEAEAAAHRVTEHGAVGVVLRFAMFHAHDSDHVGTFLDMARDGLAPFYGAPPGYVSFVDAGDAARAVVAALEVPPGIYNVAEPNPATRAEHAAALARLFGKPQLHFISPEQQEAAGDAAEELARSQRISSRSLREAGAWEPRVETIHRWKDFV